MERGAVDQAEAAQLLGLCERSFRRYVVRYEAEGLAGLADRRLEQVSQRRAPVDEVLAVTDRYQRQHLGWNVRHFHSWYRRDGGQRSYSWVKQRLQAAGLVAKGKAKGVHRRKRERKALPGMLLHQDGSRYEWVVGQQWDLIVTMDDATNEHYSMFLVEEEGTASSFQGVGETIETTGCSARSTAIGAATLDDAAAGGKVDKVHLTQLGRALQQLGSEMSAAARGPGSLGEGLCHATGAVAEGVGRCRQHRPGGGQSLYRAPLPAGVQRRIAVPAREEGSHEPWIGGPLDDILCEAACGTAACGQLRQGRAPDSVPPGTAPPECAWRTCSAAATGGSGRSSAIIAA